MAKGSKSKETRALDFEKYQYGALAARLYNSKENRQYSASALEVLAGSKGLNLGEEALGFIRGTQASEKGIQTAIEVYNEKFEEERGKYKPIDMVSWYDSVLADIAKEDKKKIVDTLKEHDETIESINKKVFEASYIANPEAPEKLFTEDQISKAKKTLEKYQNLRTVMQVLDSYKFETLRVDVINEARKKDLKNLASKL